jgi:hypothetical protein
VSAATGFEDGTTKRGMPDVEYLDRSEETRPARKKLGPKLPVMVAIHGGGFIGGWSGMPVYGGSGPARKGIVYYRSTTGLACWDSWRIRISHGSRMTELPVTTACWTKLTPCRVI